MGEPTSPTTIRCGACGSTGQRATWETDPTKLGCASCGMADDMAIVACGHCGRGGPATRGRCAWCTDRYAQVLVTAGDAVAFEVDDAPGFWPHCVICGGDVRRPAAERPFGGCDRCRDVVEPDRPQPGWLPPPDAVDEGAVTRDIARMIGARRRVDVDLVDVVDEGAD